MLVVPLMGIAVAGSHASLTHDDHARWAPVDAEPAAGADILVNDEDDVVAGVGPGQLGINGVADRVRRQHVNALPRTDIDAALTHDALGLVDVKKLLRFDRLGQLV